MRSPTGLALLGAAALLALTPASRPAGAASSPTCEFSAVVTLDPGLSRLPGRGTFATPKGQAGKYACHGPFGYGKGPSGTATATGDYGTADADTCSAGGEGTGTLRLAGRSGKFTFTYERFVDGVATGRFDSAHLSGRFTITALEGNCLTSPVRRARLEGEGKPKR